MSSLGFDGDKIWTTVLFACPALVLTARKTGQQSYLRVQLSFCLKRFPGRLGNNWRPETGHLHVWDTRPPPDNETGHLDVWDTLSPPDNETGHLHVWDTRSPPDNETGHFDVWDTRSPPDNETGHLHVWDIRCPPGNETRQVLQPQVQILFVSVVKTVLMIKRLQFVH